MSIGVFIERLAYRLFPVMRVINFGRNDGIVEAVYGVGKDDVSFFLLKTPTHKDDFADVEKIRDRKLKSKCPFIELKFYSSESVGRFIENLEKLKEKMLVAEISDVIENGGTLVWGGNNTKIGFPGAEETWLTGTYIINDSANPQSENKISNNKK